jgi:cyclic pyranopterin phosphate synthase
MISGMPDWFRKERFPVQDQGDANLTHFDALGRARMVDVGGKEPGERMARAGGHIRMSASTLAVVAAGTAAKGDVLGVARVAAILAAKRTAELVPLCHPLPLTRVEVDLRVDAAGGRVVCESRVHTHARTGVEMEALMAVQVGLLTVYDMCKSMDRAMVIGEVRLLEKRGGVHGDWVAP